MPQIGYRNYWFLTLGTGTGAIVDGDLAIEIDDDSIAVVVEDVSAVALEVDDTEAALTVADTSVALVVEDVADIVLVIGEDGMSKTALIEVAKGADATKRLVFTSRSTGLPFDLSIFGGGGGAEIELAVKSAATDATTEAFAILTLTGGELAFETDGTDGILLATFARALTDPLTEDAAEWFFDVKGTEVGPGAVTQLVRSSRFRLLPRVTE